MEEINQVPAASTSTNKKKKEILIVVVALLIAVLGAFFYWYWLSSQPTYKQPEVEQPAAAFIENTDIGSEIYSKANNPVEDKLPETLAPIANPIEGIYKNPFE